MSLPTAEELTRKPVKDRMETGYQYFKQKVIEFMPLLRVLPNTREYQITPEQFLIDAKIAKKYCKRFMEEEKTDIHIFYNSRTCKIVFNWRITEKRKGDEGE